MHKIVKADCLKWMQKQETDSVDLVFTSPPYEDRRSYGIDFKFVGDEWVRWCLPIFEECLRLSQGLVAWVVQGKTERYQWSATPAKLITELCDKGYIARRPAIYYSSGIPGSGGPDWLRNDYQWIICFTAKRGRLPWSDNTAMGSSPKYAKGGDPTHRKQDGGRIRTAAPYKVNEKAQQDMPHASHGGMSGTVNEDGSITRKDGSIYKHPERTNPGDIIKVSGGHLGSKLAHETEAPFHEHAAEFFIRSFCRPDGIVIDPFAGSGTTMAAAIKSGRNSINVDVRRSQFELMKRRRTEAKKSVSQE